MRIFRLLVLVGCAWVALVATDVSRARACTPASTCLHQYGVQPADGARGVLRNVELRIDYGTDGQYERLDALPTLEDVAGVAVEVTWTRSLGMLRGTLRAPLAANTWYRLRHAFAACTTGGCVGYGLCSSEVGTTIATFITGDTVVETKPTPVVFEAPEVGPTIRVTEPSACGPYERCTYERKFAPLAAGHSLRLVRRDQTFLEARSPSPLRVDVYLAGSRFAPISGAVHQLGGVEYDVYVVDEAGHRSDPVVLDIPACAPYSQLQDAGYGAVVDGGGSVDGGINGVDTRAPAVDSGVGTAVDATTPARAAGSDGGCSVGSPHARSAAHPALIGLLVLGLWRLRSRQAGVRFL